MVFFKPFRKKQDPRILKQVVNLSRLLWPDVLFEKSGEYCLPPQTDDPFIFWRLGILGLSVHYKWCVRACVCVCVCACVCVFVCVQERDKRFLTLSQCR